MMIARTSLCILLGAWGAPAGAQAPLPLPDPLLPPPAERTSYSVPDTALDLSLIAPPASQPGDRMTIAPAIHDAPELTLEIPVP